MPLDEEEVVVLVLARLEMGFAALVDLVGGGGDHRAGGLAEDLGEADDRGDLRGDQVLEGLARSDRRQLVGVADEDDVGRLGEAAEQDLDQAQVEHRGLVDDHQVGRQRMPRLEGRLAARAPLEHAVDRLGGVAGCLLEAAGGATGGSAEGDAQVGAFGLLDDRPRAGCLADAGAAGEHGDPRPEGAAHRRPLLVGQLGVRPVAGGRLAGVVVEVGRGGAAGRQGRRHCDLAGVGELAVEAALVDDQTACFAEHLGIWSEAEQLGGAGDSSAIGR